MTAATKPTLTHKAATSAALSGLFVLIYSTCNWLTSLRRDVPSQFFDWERRTPFIPALILPYMSIDLFFIAAPFLLHTPAELRLFARRIAAAILFAAFFFLLFPLKFAFIRPHVAGPLGILFNNFRTLDLPYNEFPSLHITLWCLLLDVYLRHSKGFPRLLLILWFTLIAASTIFTYQHHLVDILGGFGLAILCFYLFGELPLRTPFLPNRRLAACYACLAILLTALAFTFRPYTLILLWPAFAVALVALGYLTFGPGIYRKHHGQIPFSARLLLAPVLLGQHLSLLYYARQCRPTAQLTSTLLIGRRLSKSEAAELSVAAVIDLTAEFSEPSILRRLPYLSLPILDLTAPTPAQITQALAFIRHHTPAGIIYLHCKIGYSRTAAIAGAYLISESLATSPAHAIALLRAARPSIIIRPEALRALESFAATASPITPSPRAPASA